MDYSAFRILRLNAEMFPVSASEREEYDRRGIAPDCIEVAGEQPLREAVHDADAVMVVSQTLSAAAIGAMNKCRVICRLGAGTDKIDVAAATARGIVVANVPDFCVEEQADHAFALLLAVARKLSAMHRLMLEGRYDEGRREARPLRRLRGRTLGLVGFGGSGRAMAHRAAGFGMQVIATRKRKIDSDPVAAELNVEMVTLEELLARSDYVSLHLPLNHETHHLLNRQTLAQMKQGSILINTARGAIVDEDALADALARGQLAGAGLDTFAQVDVHATLAAPPEHPLFERDNVVVTPHVAAFSVESSQDVARGSVANLIAVLAGELPPRERLVNPEVVPRG